MFRIAVSLPPALEDRVVHELLQHGHQVALRAVNIQELAAGARSGNFEYAVTGAGARYLSAELLEVCDNSGVRLIAFAHGDVERRLVAELGLREVLDAAASWEELQAVLTDSPIFPSEGRLAPRALAELASNGLVSSKNSPSAVPPASDSSPLTSSAELPFSSNSPRSAAKSSATTQPGSARPDALRPEQLRPERLRLEQSRSFPDPTTPVVQYPVPGDKAEAVEDVGIRRGRVIAVWGPSGSPGRTTLAICLASELAAEGYSVALGDADTHSGSIAPALGLLDEAPGFAAACRLAGAESLNRHELERIGQRYHSPHGNFWVLTGIGRPSRWTELSGERVVATVRACREWVDFTVLDTASSLENDEEISSDLFAPRRNAATISALREADHVIAVGSADPVGLSRFLRAHVDLIEVVEGERVTVVMNKVRSSAIGMNPAVQVEQTLRRFGGITAAALIPHDQPALDAAVLSGKTLWDVAGKSPARLAVHRLVASHLLAG